jgi:hypothetical protein
MIPPSSLPAANDVGTALRGVLPTAADRVVRLFSLACMRRVRHLLGETLRDALDVAERHVDGHATDADLAAAVKAVKRAPGRRRDREWAVYHAVRYVKGSPQAEAVDIAARAATIARDAIAPPERAPACFGHTARMFVVTFARNADEPPLFLSSAGEAPPADASPDVVAAFNEAMRELRAAEASDEAEAQRQAAAQEAEFRQACADAEAARLAAFAAERAAQLALLHDLFPPGGRHPLPPACGHPDLIALARRIYAEQTFEQLPQLADKLQAAGCTDTTLLEHCRQEAPHARGCWALDAVMGL